MSIQKINMVGVQPSFRASEEIKAEVKTTNNTPTETENPESNHKVRNWAIGLSAAAVLIGLGVAGRRGKLGEGMQRLLGGKSATAAEHSAGNAGAHATGDAAAAGTKAGEGAASATEHAATGGEIKIDEISTEDFAHIQNKEVDFIYDGKKIINGKGEPAPKTEQPKIETPKEEPKVITQETKTVEEAGNAAEQTVTATETKIGEDAEDAVLKAEAKADDAAMTEGRDKASIEAEQAAKKAEAKAAHEAAQKAYDEEMQARFKPQAEALIKDLNSAWGEEAARATRLYEQAEVEGFSSLKGVADALKDGTHRITFTTPSGVKYEYLSKHGDMLDEIRVFGKDGELSHVAEFYRANESTPVVDIFKKTGDFYDGSLASAHVNFEGDHIAFEMSRKNPRFLEWSTKGVLDPEKMVHIQPGHGKYYVTYSGNQSKDVLGNGFWIEP